MENENVQEVQDGKISLAKKFQADREKWTKNVEKFSKRLMNIKEIPELQVEVFSSRQMLVEYMTNLQNIYSKKMVELKKERFKVFDENANKKNVRLVSQEKAIIMDGKTADASHSTALIETQIDFYKETIKTIDSIIYGIKNRIDLEQYRIG